VLALNPDDPIAYYNVGRAYQAMTPPQQMDAFWYFSKAVTAKGRRRRNLNRSDIPTEADRELSGRKRLRQPDGCRAERLLQLASTSAERPESYKLPSSADLDTVRNGPPVMTIASVVTDLKLAAIKPK